MACYPIRAQSSRQLPRTAATLPLLLVALLLAVTPHRTLAQLSAGAHLRPQHGHMDNIPSAQHIAEHELPFAAADGVVTGVANVEAQADFAAAGAGSRRALLHGKRRPRNYATCPRCTLISCRTGTNSCSGHCKTSRRLFACNTTSRVAPICDDDPSVRPDPYTVPADPLHGRRSVKVTAPAPYIACANVTGAPDGCPPAGTTGTLVGGGGVTVVAATCMQHLYSLACAAKAPLNRAPFHPFGYCQCFMRKDSGAPFRAPCRTTDVDWSGSGAGGGVPVSVSTEGILTRTDIGVREEADEVESGRRHTFETPEGPIEVKMQVYNALEGPGYDIVDEGPLPGADGKEEEEEEEEEEEGEEEEGEQEESPLEAFLRGFKSS